MSFMARAAGTTAPASGPRRAVSNTIARYRAHFARAGQHSSGRRPRPRPAVRTARAGIGMQPMTDIILRATALTAAAFAPFGDVIETAGRDFFWINEQTCRRFD